MSGGLQGKSQVAHLESLPAGDQQGQTRLPNGKKELPGGRAKRLHPFIAKLFSSEVKDVKQFKKINNQ